MRSIWKPDYFSKALLRLSSSEARITTQYKIYDKSSVIPQFLENKRVLLHNGHKFISFLVRDYHIGRKFSQFLTCKVIGPKIHSKTKKTPKKGSKKK